MDQGISLPRAAMKLFAGELKPDIRFLMLSYKRNQAVEAISISVGHGAAPSAGLRTELKRLLDTDRNLDRIPGSNDPERANCAFFSGEAPGRGTEVWFSAYEIFALRMGLDLMEHGWPQATAVSILRRARVRNMEVPEGR